MGERWISGPAWAKALSLFATCGLLVAMIEYAALQPRQARLQEALLAQQQARLKVARLRHKVVGLAVSTRARSGAEASPRPFSLVDLLSASGGELHKWLPADKPATLELRVAWEKLPGLFAVLSGYDAVHLQAFSVEPEGARLRLTLKLDLADAP
ncbi:HofO family protein [Dryocola clanedunensis]